MGCGSLGLLLLLTGFAAQSVLARNYEIIMERIEGYEANPQFISPESFMRIRRTSKTAIPSLFHTIVIPKPLPNTTQVEATIFEMRDNKLVPSWLKYKNNFCEYVANEKRPIFNELSRAFKFTPCPLSGVFKIEDWRPDDRLLPPVLPGPDRMMLGFKLSVGATSVLKYGVLFLVDRSKGLRGGGTGGRGGKNP